ncbi:MAG: hypothetical protein J0H01_08975 [Rhizobiales bacterium]|nr:hypothetical protein [Hyphomicrobiales bacterium]
MAPTDGKTRTLIGLVVALTAIFGPAGARPADDVAAARAWGILGTWRVDCSAPPSLANGSLTYAIRGERLVHPRDFGTERDELQVLSARILPTGLFEFVIELPRDGQRRRFTLARGHDGRIRVMDNVAVGTRDYSIRDGALVATGKPSRWQTRCESEGVGASVPLHGIFAAPSRMTDDRGGATPGRSPQG